MRSNRFLTACLIAAVSLSLAPGCAHRETTFQLYPSAADLKAEPKPRLKPEDLGSAAALDAHEIALEAWGERGWKAVARVCQWAKTNGMEVTC